MTKLEAIQMIGDIVTEIDVARGSLLPDDPNRCLAGQSSSVDDSDESPEIKGGGRIKGGPQPHP